MKIKSLAEEARIIRKEEKRSKDRDERERLYLHRIIVVRVEARSALLLNAFAKWQHERSVGRFAKRWEYKNVEPKAYHDYWWRQAVRKAKESGKRFGVDTADFDKWLGG